MSQQTLRGYQLDALNELRNGIRAKTGPQCLMLPTGAGKTTVASAMKQGVQERGKRAFFVVDSLELVDQAVERFVADGLDVGVIQGQHEMTNYRCPIQVATIQTLRSRWEHIAQAFKPDLLVIDECHVLHKAHLEIIEECNKAGVPVIGLSATPFRRGLGRVFKRLVVGTTLAELTEQGFLVPARCYAPSIPDLKGLKTTTTGDWADDALAEVMGDAKIMGDVVENWLHLAEKMGVSESLISRQKSEGHLAKTAEMLTHLGLKVVPEGVQCFDPEYVEHLRALAQLGLRQPSADQVLEWDE